MSIEITPTSWGGYQAYTGDDRCTRYGDTPEAALQRAEEATREWAEMDAFERQNADVIGAMVVCRAVDTRDFFPRTALIKGQVSAARGPNGLGLVVTDPDTGDAVAVTAEAVRAATATGT